MRPESTIRTKGLLVLLMVCAMVCAQVTALAHDNDHHDSQHCCALCHVGLGFLQPAVTATAPPVLSVVWLASFADQETAPQVLLTLASSRAPPALVSEL